ncbi:MAG: hypothetical protein OXD45_02630, partial [Rhodobacteraceae bacterium]|nr:hypothetical protein [Paracoccaceae bacterium]MCY4307842.1 hypothetical protein [Paracoccaceae bacterium]
PFRINMVVNFILARVIIPNSFLAHGGVLGEFQTPSRTRFKAFVERGFRSFQLHLPGLFVS